jgi:hypothetical protein
MCGRLYVTRIPALRKHNVTYDPRRPAEEFHAQLPPEVRWKADNYNNLLEQPTVFYAVTLTLAFLGAGSCLSAGLAWTYVALRVAHSLVQATINRVMIRFALFAAASVVLLLMTLRRWMDASFAVSGRLRRYPKLVYQGTSAHPPRLGSRASVLCG